MKHRVFWASSLVLWLLIFSTFFSLRVEKLMLPKVTLAEPKAPYGVTTYHLPLDCAFQGEQGPLIFTLYEGLMWEKGTRTMLVDPLTYSFTDEDILIWGGASEYVQYASRVPD